MKNTALGWGVVLALGAALPAIAATMDAKRPAEDVALDAARKPMEMVAFAKIKPGQMVADVIPGGGYFTRVFAKAVGPKGTVLAVVPEVSMDKHPEFKAKADAVAADYPNVKVEVTGLGKMAAPGSLDVVWTAQNYHDFHNIPDPATVAGINTAVFAQLKPGGYYVIVDHSAAAGSAPDVTSKLHRIEEATVKSEVMAAGFVLDGESQVLRNKDDPRTAMVFDPAIRHKTDQFALRFRKPK